MKLDRSSQLQRALSQVGADPARLEESLDRVIEQTGASATELRDALAHTDQFAPDQRAALERVLDRRVARTVEAPGQGARAHQVRAQQHKPWFKALADQPPLQTPLFPEPPRDIELAGEKLTRDELARLLRGAR
ncbi:MAG: hypothetical protein IT383_04155 [Deltaproteobacteria bacterium]|nr:hypothetical protein [Deltaproteobacteria bacterium]